MPDKLSEREYVWEMRERSNRKSNVIIRGMRAVGRGIKEEIKGIIKEYVGLEIYIKRVRAIGGELLVELDSMENKINIMKMKIRLRGSGIWIDDDLTRREKQVQEWLESLVKDERENGLNTRLGYFKVQVDGGWYEWDEKKGRLGQISRGIEECK